MKKSILLLFAALLPLVASAQTKVEIDGIWYNITSEADKQAEVTFKGSSYNEYSNEYSSSITIPCTVTHEGVAYSVTSIGERAFSDCSSLTTINIPEGVTSIGDDAFSGCSSLTAINIPENSQLTSIGGGAFYKCSSLTAITLPESVTSIGSMAFWHCESFTAITLPEGVTSIGEGTFSDCISLTAITLPESVTSIGGWAFESCISLTAINIPENSQLTSIGNKVFYECSSLTTITLPVGVTSIGKNDFYECSSLTDVYCYAAGVPTTNTSAFDNSNIKNATLHVPANALNAYKNTTPWRNFGNIVALTDEEMSVEQSVIEEQHELYDLQGHRVTHPTKGIYIINGRKVIIK